MRGPVNQAVADLRAVADLLESGQFELAEPIAIDTGKDRFTREAIVWPPQYRHSDQIQLSISVRNIKGGVR